jgi:hypothetical protein
MGFRVLFPELKAQKWGSFEVKTKPLFFAKIELLEKKQLPIAQ